MAVPGAVNSRVEVTIAVPGAAYRRVEVTVYCTHLVPESWSASLPAGS
jgi:hypothetical protein